MVSYLALYRKYRPTNFDDLVGQAEISNIIKNEILNDKISHAYLFSGPRGTGKTSTAKIIARMINCTNLNENGVPCGKCTSCINFSHSSDVVEIDAASNNGVDEIRELRDKVNLVPSFGKYKIYIIDEVHMLTVQAFNALLKTLEEPPAHVIFILATTEFHKIPITVVSRCQKFQFLKFSIDDIVNKLRKIADAESIIVDDDVLVEIARLSDGGLRDAINMLDQLSSFKECDLSTDDVYNLNGVISYKEYLDLLMFVFNNDAINIVNFFEKIDKNGKNYDRFIEDLITFLKDILVYLNTKNVVGSNIKEKDECIKKMGDIYTGDDIYKMILLLSDLSNKIKNSSFVKILLIADFIKISENFNKKTSNSTEKKVKNNQEDNEVKPLKTMNSSYEINKKLTNSNDFFGLGDKVRKIRINNTFCNASKNYKENFLKKWDLVLDVVSNSDKYFSIAGMINDIEVLVVGEKNIIFLAQYPSLLERLNSQIQLIEAVLFEIFNISYKVVFLLDDEWQFENKRYISNLKNNKKYSYIEENNNDVSSDPVDEEIEKLISIMGEEIIKYN